MAMTNTCPTCGNPISKNHNQCRACYNTAHTKHTKHTKTCRICNAPIKFWHATLCVHCSQSLRFARKRAAQLTADQKRAMAKAAVKGLTEKGYVKVRFLQAPRAIGHACSVTHVTRSFKVIDEPD